MAKEKEYPAATIEDYVSWNWMLNECTHRPIPNEYLGCLEEVYGRAAIILKDPNTENAEFSRSKFGGPLRLELPAYIEGDIIKEEEIDRDRLKFWSEHHPLFQSEYYIIMRRAHDYNSCGRKKGKSKKSKKLYVLYSSILLIYILGPQGAWIGFADGDKFVAGERERPLQFFYEGLERGDIGDGLFWNSTAISVALLRTARENFARFDQAFSQLGFLRVADNLKSPQKMLRVKESIGKRSFDTAFEHDFLPDFKVLMLNIGNVTRIPLKDDIDRSDSATDEYGLFQFGDPRDVICSDNRKVELIKHKYMTCLKANSTDNVSFLAEIISEFLTVTINVLGTPWRDTDCWFGLETNRLAKELSDKWSKHIALIVSQATR